MERRGWARLGQAGLGAGQGPKKSESACSGFKWKPGLGSAGARARARAIRHIP